MIEKQNNLFRQKFIFALLGSLVAFSGCRYSIQTVEYQRAEQSFEEQKFKEALVHYEKVVVAKPKTAMALEAARRGARIAHLETSEFQKAIAFYRHLVLYSQDENERMEAQKKIASVYFEKLSDYSNSIKEYSRLVQLPHSQSEDLEYRFSIAKSYFYLSNFYQAAIEMKEILDRVKDKSSRFEYLAFQGNIFLTTKKLDEAIEIFRFIMEQYPEESMKENVPISLAVTYEEKGDFKEAIQVLEKIRKIHPSPEFLELRIKRLRERVLNQPGARGLTK